MRKMFVLVMCLLLCLLTVAGCGKEPAQEVIPTEITVETTPTVAETVPTETEPQYDIVVVSTIYGDICYQEQWSEHMKVEFRDEGGSLTACFRAEFNGIQYPLFDLIIGVGEDEAVAQMTGADGVARGVGVTFMELGEYPELADDQQNQLYAMQEDINFVIENIK